MTWLKVSDNAAFHEVVTHPLTEPVPTEPFDPADMVNLVFGLVLRCATHSADFTTDYVVKDGTVALMAGPHWLARAQLAERAGYWERITGGWRIIEDSEHFVHIRLKAELDWEKQRRRDTSDTALVVPVRLRDGDGCRYCGLIVNWNDRKSNRGGTYDHRVPSTQATSPDDLLVACQGCNGFRSNRPDANEARPARPAPSRPFYGALTAAFLEKHGHVVPQTPGTQPGFRNPASSQANGSTTAAPQPPAAADDAAPRTSQAGERDATAHRGDDQPAGQPGQPAPRARRTTRGRGHRNPAPSRTNGRTTATGQPGRQDDAAPERPRRDDDAAPRSPRPGREAGARPHRPAHDAASTNGEARGPAPRPRGAAPAPPPRLGSARYLPDPADPRHEGFGSPGRDGPGRVFPTSTPYVAVPSSRRSRRRPQPPSAGGQRHV